MSVGTVYWEENPERTRVALRYCRICFPCPLNETVMLVSPAGVVHQADGDTTDCGHDATGPDWWWRT